MTMETNVRNNVFFDRIVALFAAAFAGLATVLAAIGRAAASLLFRPLGRRAACARRRGAAARGCRRGGRILAGAACSARRTADGAALRVAVSATAARADRNA